MILSGLIMRSSAKACADLVVHASVAEMISEKRKLYIHFLANTTTAMRVSEPLLLKPPQKKQRCLRDVAAKLYQGK